MKIKVDYIESSYDYEMVKLDTGKIMNLGGRNLPF